MGEHLCVTEGTRKSAQGRWPCQGLRQAEEGTGGTVEGNTARAKPWRQESRWPALLPLDEQTLCPPWAWTLQVVTPQGPSDGNSPASDFLPEMSLKLPPGTSST